MYAHVALSSPLGWRFCFFVRAKAPGSTAGTGGVFLLDTINREIPRQGQPGGKSTREEEGNKTRIAEKDTIYIINAFCAASRSLFGTNCETTATTVVAENNVVRGYRAPFSLENKATTCTK